MGRGKGNFRCASFLHDFFKILVYHNKKWQAESLPGISQDGGSSTKMDIPYPLPLLLDGATGTNLIFREHMPLEQCPEQWILRHPQALLRLQRDFVRAGSQVLLAPTFQANSLALQKYGLSEEDIRFNRELVALTKQAAPNGVLVAGSIGPTGQSIEPFGELYFQTVVDAYRRQGQALRDAGVDLLVCETMTTLPDARAALLASKETGLPVFVSVVVNGQGEMPDGTDILCALTVLQAMGADAFGINCSGTPEETLPWIEKIAPYAKIPLLAKPNPGSPNPVNLGQYDLGPDIFAKQVGKLVDTGVAIVGGCCGTSPEHIAALSKMLRQKGKFAVHQVSPEDEVLASSEHEVFFLSEDMTIGEALPCEYDMADTILKYEDSGCDLILVEIETEDDAYHLGRNAHMFRLPVLITSHSEELLQEALFEFQGRALIDSRCGIESSKLDGLAKRYGAIVY